MHQSHINHLKIYLQFEFKRSRIKLFSILQRVKSIISKTISFKKIHPYKNLPLDIAIGIAGVLLIGFIYSLSQNTVHTGVPIKVKFPN